MSALAERLEVLADAREQSLAALTGLTIADLERPAAWRGGDLDVRFLLLQIADSDDERRVHLRRTLRRAGWQPTEAQQILADAARVRGRLLGVLVDVPDALLDTAPAAGEWPLRAVIGHVVNTEERYTIHAAYAWERVSRAAAGHDPGPVRVSADRLPPLTASGPAGPLADIRRTLRGSQSAVFRALAGVPDGALAADTDWVGVPLDLRFRLHRFAAHERQHLVQVLKTLQDIGVRQTEAQLILGEAEQSRAALLSHLIGLPDEVAARQDAAEPSVLDLLQDAERGERMLVESILARVA